MGMTLTQKILAAHAGLAEVKAGQLINAKLDIVLGNDITTPVAINEFERAGFDSVFDKEHIAIVLDHAMPNKDIRVPPVQAVPRVRQQYDILSFYDVGQMGIERPAARKRHRHCWRLRHRCGQPHLPTVHWVAFSTGVGSTDMAAGMACRHGMVQVPSAIKFVLKGKFSPRVSART